jgi:putative sigma-54 modulation protein
MAMKVDIFTRNMELSERLQDYVSKKASKLDRYLTGIDEAKVDLAFVKSARSAADRQVAQVTVYGKGFILRTEERADDIFAAIDAALEKMQRQMERYKGKRYHGRGDGTPASEVAAPATEPEEISEPESLVVKRKKFTMVPMDENEAIDQMTLLGHESFFVFYNANTNQINVIYTRRDGSYGLIEPEVG